MSESLKLLLFRALFLINFDVKKLLEYWESRINEFEENVKFKNEKLKNKKIEKKKKKKKLYRTRT